MEQEKQKEQLVKQAFCVGEQGSIMLGFVPNMIENVFLDRGMAFHDDENQETFLIISCGQQLFDLSKIRELNVADMVFPGEFIVKEDGSKYVAVKLSEGNVDNNKIVI